jgi:hypothetical protein
VSATRGSSTIGRGDPVYQSFRMLQLGFVVAPILAGLDKFFNILTDWTDYLAPVIADNLPFSASTLMMIIGVVEIVAGLIVAFRPRIGGFIVAAWLGAIILNLLLAGDYYDVALRDLGLALGALSLARLASVVAPTGAGAAVGSAA